MDDNNLFCPYCGTKAGGNGAAMSDASSQQTFSPQSYQAPTPWNAGAVNSYANAGSVPITFSAKKVFGQFLVSNVTLEIGNQQYKVGFGKTMTIPIPSGWQAVTCYMNYLGKSGMAKAQYNFIPGRQYTITYSSPMFVTSAGTLRIY
jgi:hypothetical protein